MGILAFSQPNISPPSRPVTPNSLSTAVVGDRVLQRQHCSAWNRGLGPWLPRCDVIRQALTVVMLRLGRKAAVARCV